MDDVIDLINYTGRRYDEQGNEILDKTKRRIFVKTRSVYHSEFYEAAQVDLQPTIAFMVSNMIDYQGEKEVEYHGQVYDVIRVDWDDRGETVTLQCEVKAKDGSEFDGTTGCNSCTISGQGEEGTGEGCSAGCNNNCCEAESDISA